MRKNSSRKPARKTVAASPTASAELLHKLPGSKVVSFATGDVIFREGARADTCYVITSGKVRILKRTARGGQIPLAVIKREEFLGEMATLSGHKRSASAVAMTHVEAIEIDHKKFVALLKARNPLATRLSLQLATLLASRCHHLLRLIARQPEIVPMGMKKVPHVDVRAVFNRVYTLWAV